MNIINSSKVVELYLDLDRRPVGVKFFYSEDQEDFDSLGLDLYDRKITYCNAVQRASKGHAFKLDKLNQGCPNGAFAMGFTPVPQPIESGQGRHKLGIYDSLDVSERVSKGMKFMEEKPLGITVMPLKDYKSPPDIVIVVGQPYNIMRLIQGYGHHYGTSDNFKTCGLMAVCNDLTTYPMNTGDINMTFLCPGTRLVADWEQGEVGIGIPWDKWENTVDGLVKTTNPFERDEKKKQIAAKLEEAGLDSSDLEFGKNYDSGSYTGGEIAR